MHDYIDDSGDSIKKILSSSKTISNSSWNNVNYETVNYDLKYELLASESIEVENSDKGLYMLKDDYGKSYYYRGNVKNNNVYFDGFYWKIVRINGNQTLRLIYNGKSINDLGPTIGNVKYNEDGSSPAYVGYMYGKEINTRENSIKNEVDSTVKSIVDNWYKNNILNTNFENFVADSGFCNDRSLSSGDGYSVSKDTHFGAYERMATSTAQLVCPDVSNDLFTLNTSSIGNKALTYPIGLITIDELLLSGITNHVNKYSYLYTPGLYRTMTPSAYGSINKMADTYMMYGSGYRFSYGVSSGIGIRPVINLKVEVEISGGIGTVNDPYIVKTT